MVYIEILALVFFVLVLAKSSSIVVGNATKLSKFFGISQLAIGFLLISVLTSLPELSIAVVSSSIGEGSISAGNVFGANIANIFLVLGIGAALYGLKIGKTELRDISIILVLTTIMSAYIIFNSIVEGHALGMLEGIILIFLFGGYAIYIISKKKAASDGYHITKHNALYAFLYFTTGLILVLISSGFVVDFAVKISGQLAIAESLIGATIIAIGTTLPEMSINIQAIRKKHYGLALGNATGSIMTNFTLVLGVAATINPILIILPIFAAALLFAIIANMLLFYAAAVNNGLQRVGGLMFLAIYAIYIITIFYLQLASST